MSSNSKFIRNRITKLIGKPETNKNKVISVTPVKNKKKTI